MSDILKSSPIYSSKSIEKGETRTLTDGKRVYEFAFFDNGGVNTKVTNANGFVLSTGSSIKDRALEKIDQLITQGFKEKSLRVVKNKLSEFVRRVGGTLNEQPIFTALDTYESGRRLAQDNGGTQVRSSTGVDGSRIESWRIPFPEGDVLLTYGQYGKNKPWKMQIQRGG